MEIDRLTKRLVSTKERRSKVEVNRTVLSVLSSLPGTPHNGNGNLIMRIMSLPIRFLACSAQCKKAAVFLFLSAALLSGIVDLRADGQEPPAMLKIPNFRPNEVNEFTFDETDARYLRVTVAPDNACLDEIEIYEARSNVNIAPARFGTTIQPGCTKRDSETNRPENLIDGRFGNAHSWTASRGYNSFILKFPVIKRLAKIRLSRDRGEKICQDSLLAGLSAETSGDGITWAPVTNLAAYAPGPVPSIRSGDFFDWMYSFCDNWFRDDADQTLINSAAVHKFIAAPRNDLALPENERRFMLQRLQYEFNPDAIERAAADLAENSDEGTFVLPNDFKEKLARYRRLLPSVSGYLQSGDNAALENCRQEISAKFDGTEEEFHQEMMNLCREMIAFQKDILLRNPALDFDEILLLQREQQPESSEPYWTWGVEYGMPNNWSCDFRPWNKPYREGLRNSFIAVSTKKGRRFSSCGAGLSACPGKTSPASAVTKSRIRPFPSSITFLPRRLRTRLLNGKAPPAALIFRTKSSLFLIASVSAAMIRTIR